MLLNLVYLTKTVLVIVIKEFVTYGLFIIFYRGLFNFALVALYFLKQKFIQKKIYKPMVVIIFSYGIITSFIITYNHTVDHLVPLEMTEMSLIYYVLSMMR